MGRMVGVGLISMFLLHHTRPLPFIILLGTTVVFSLCCMLVVEMEITISLVFQGNIASCWSNNIF
jgi:hypothetical protein